MKINPNHPVTQMLDDEMMHKISAVLVSKAGGRVEISMDDLQSLTSMFGGEQPTLVTKFGTYVIELWLVSESEARAIAKGEGGLPV